MRKVYIWLLTLGLSLFVLPSFAEDVAYQLGAGDLLKITVHNNPDLSIETRVSESGDITYPLIGQVPVKGLTASGAENKIANMLSSGGYLKKPQVNVLITQFQSKTVSVLGGVYRPGRYSLERVSTLVDVLALAGGVVTDASDFIKVTSGGISKQYDIGAYVNKGDASQNIALNGGEVVFVQSQNVSVLGQVNRPGKYSIKNSVRTLADFLSMAGGVTQLGSDKVIVNSIRDGRIQQLELDIDKVFKQGDDSANFELMTGDTVYVPRAPMVYVYGEVQRPGAYKIDGDMSLMQALALGGGPTMRGTQRGIQINRRNAAGDVEKINADINDKVQADDVVFVRESLF